MISVIIPCYNEADNLPKLLAQLRASDCRLQIIVVDGGSTDDTVALAEQYTDEVFVAAKGRSVQMNAGAEMAKGELLWFLHADTALDEHVDSYIKQLQGATWGFFRVRLSSAEWYFRLIGTMISWRSRVQGIGTGDQGLFVRRDIFARLGGYAAIPLMEDIALCQSLKKITAPKVARLRLITSSRRWRQYGVIKTVLLMWYLRFLYGVGVSPERLIRRYYV